MGSGLYGQDEEPTQVSTEDQRQKWISIVCWGVLISLALLETWTGRRYADPDAVCYLDMSDALLRHNWHLLVNPLWSPLYPFLIGVATSLLRPSAYWEFPVVHVVNFVIFLSTIASFEILLRQIIHLRQQGSGECTDQRPLKTWMWQLLGYSLFAWSTFVMINGLRKVTPDLLVATIVYLDTALLLRLRTESIKLRTYLLLGLTLGLGYYAKAILFPVGFVFMAVAFFAATGRPKRVLPLVLTFLVFSVIAAPLFFYISQMVGRPTFSESGSLNYAWHVNGMT